MSVHSNPEHSDRQTSTSRQAAAAAVRMALSVSREEERELKSRFASDGIQAAAVDFGGDFLSSVSKLIERAVVAANREAIIGDTHAEQGAVAGAAHEAAQQLINKATGLNVGGKIGLARMQDHISVCMFFGIGLVHLDDVAISLGHRVI